MPIEARDAIAGRRYRLQTGDVVEILANPAALRAGQIKQIRSRDGAFVHANAVSEQNEIIPEKRTNPLVIPLFYLLEAWDGRPPQALSKPVVAIQEPIKRRGRTEKIDTLWMGWAVGYIQDMDSLLGIMKSEAGWVSPIVKNRHYYLCGYNKEPILGLYRWGELGFRETPNNAVLRRYPLRTRTKPPNFLPWRIDLSAVMATGKWTELMNLTREYIARKKNAILQGAKA